MGRTQFFLHPPSGGLGRAVTSQCAPAHSGPMFLVACGWRHRVLPAPRGAAGAGIEGGPPSSGVGLLWGHFLVLVPSQGWPTRCTLILTSL